MTLKPIKIALLATTILMTTAQANHDSANRAENKPLTTQKESSDALSGMQVLSAVMTAVEENYKKGTKGLIQASRKCYKDKATTSDDSIRECVYLDFAAFNIIQDKVETTHVKPDPYFYGTALDQRIESYIQSMNMNNEERTAFLKKAGADIIQSLYEMQQQ